VEYFVEGVHVSVQEVKERVIRLSSERLRKTKKGQIALTERQMQIVEFINQNGQITNRDVRKLFKLSDEGALKEIKKLVKSGVIRSSNELAIRLAIRLAIMKARHCVCPPFYLAEAILLRDMAISTTLLFAFVRLWRKRSREHPCIPFPLVPVRLRRRRGLKPAPYLIRG
jgi:hypothetical protein